MRATSRRSRAAWAARDEPALAAVGARIGCALAVEPLAVLDRLRGDVPLADVVLAIAQARLEPTGIALREHPTNAMRDRVVVLAVRGDAEITTGIATLRRATPLRTRWPELKPWFGELAKNRARALAWATCDGADRVRVPLLATPADAPHPEQAELIRQIAASPHDRALRLVLADLLLERDDPRGELMRLWLDDPIDNGERIAALEARLRSAIAGGVAEHASDFSLAGGFVDSVTLTAAKAARVGDALFRAHPIRELVIEPMERSTLARLVTLPLLARVRALRLGRNTWRSHPVDLARFAGVPLDALEELVFDGGVIDGAGLVAPRLRALELRGSSIAAPALRALLHGAPALEHPRCSRRRTWRR